MVSLTLVDDTRSSSEGLSSRYLTTNLSVNMAIKIEEANAAIEDLETRLNELRVPVEKLSDIRSDIATIKAQLAKSTPSHSIVREATHSIRNAVHEVAGEMISPAATAAITALGKVTGAF